MQFGPSTRTPLSWCRGAEVGLERVAGVPPTSPKPPLITCTNGVTPVALRMQVGATGRGDGGEHVVDGRRDRREAGVGGHPVDLGRGRVQREEAVGPAVVAVGPRGSGCRTWTSWPTRRPRRHRAPREHAAEVGGRLGVGRRVSRDLAEEQTRVDGHGTLGVRDDWVALQLGAGGSEVGGEVAMATITVATASRSTPAWPRVPCRIGAPRSSSSIVGGAVIHGGARIADDVVEHLGERAAEAHGDHVAVAVVDHAHDELDPGRGLLLDEEPGGVDPRTHVGHDTCDVGVGHAELHGADVALVHDGGPERLHHERAAERVDRREVGGTGRHVHAACGEQGLDLVLGDDPPFGVDVVSPPGA